MHMLWYSVYLHIKPIHIFFIHDIHDILCSLHMCEIHLYFYSYYIVGCILFTLIIINQQKIKELKEFESLALNDTHTHTLYRTLSPTWAQRALHVQTSVCYSEQWWPNSDPYHRKLLPVLTWKKIKITVRTEILQKHRPTLWLLYCTCRRSWCLEHSLSLLGKVLV